MTDSLPKLNGKGWLMKGLIYAVIAMASVAVTLVSERRPAPAVSGIPDREVIDRLARIETKIDETKVRVDKIETTLNTHIDRQK